MSNYKLSENEKLLLQEIVGLNTKKFKTKLTLTNQKLVFEQEKGLFKKKLELIEIIDLKEIFHLPLAPLPIVKRQQRQR